MTDGARPPLRPPSIEDPVVLARYPFLPQASDHTKELARTHAIGLDELIESRFMESARTRARARLPEALSSEDGIDPGSSRHLFTEEGRLHEIFSFYYARLVVCATGDERTVSRWAQAEATRAERLLVEDPANLPSIASTYLSNPIQSDVGPSLGHGMGVGGSPRRFHRDESIDHRCSMETRER